MLRKNTFQKLQVLALAIATTYFLVFLFFLFFGKSETPSFLSDYESGTALEGEKGVVMKHIKRVEFKDGQRNWNLEARSLNYAEAQGVTYLSMPVVSIFDTKKKNPTIVKANNAKVVSTSDLVKTAYLEGNVQLDSPEGLKVESPSAEYDSVSSKVYFPQDAKITGPGYEVIGEQLWVQTDVGILDFKKDVRSTFTSATKTKLPNIQSFKNS